MFKFLTDLWHEARLRRVLESEIQRRQIPVVQIEVEPSRLVLQSFAPDRKQQGGFQGESFEYYHSIWDGAAYFPFWGEKLHVSLSVSAPRPSPKQLDDIRRILAYPQNIRGDIETAIFNHYKTDVFYEGATDIDGKPLPALNSAKKIRKLLRGPVISPVHRSDDSESDALEFQLGFGCGWDEDHGLDVHIRDWQIVTLR